MHADEPIDLEADPGAAQRWYRLDARNVIVDVDTAWDVFARANGGDAACSANVVGRPLEDFLAGDITRMFVRAALQAARVTGRTRRLRYRCDGPQVERSFSMTLRPTDAGGVLVAHELLHAAARPSAMPRSRMPEPPMLERRAVTQCSQCLRVRALDVGRGAWLSVHQFSRRHPSNAGLRVVDDDVCSRCALAALTA